MLKPKHIWAVVIGGVAAIAIAASFCGAPIHEIYRETTTGPDYSGKYHIIPYALLWTLQQANANEGAVAFFTGCFVAAFTLGLVILGFKADGHFKVTERAYVKISHVSDGRPSALQWSPPGSGNGSVRIQVKNFGRTPATVSALFVTAKFFQRGKEPDFTYDGSKKNIVRDGAFLAPEDTVFRDWNITIRQNNAFFWTREMLR